MQVGTAHDVLADGAPEAGAPSDEGATADQLRERGSPGIGGQRGDDAVFDGERGQRRADDAGRAITLYCDLIARAALDGLERSQGNSGVDIGALAEPPAEDLPSVVFKGIEAARGEADDLKRITGINPKLELRLNDAGVFHFWQLADLDADHVAALDRLLKLKGQIAKDDWVGQAKKLSEVAV